MTVSNPQASCTASLYYICFDFPCSNASSRYTSDLCNLDMPPLPTTKQHTERSYYDGDVDFDLLAAEDADFAAICKVSKDKRWVDFQDPNVVQWVPWLSLRSQSR